MIYRLTGKQYRIFLYRLAEKIWNKSVYISIGKYEEFTSYDFTTGGSMIRKVSLPLSYCVLCVDGP